MKKTILAALLGLAACAPNPNLVTFDMFSVKPGPTCDSMAPTDTDPLVIAGSVDLAAGAAFLVKMRITSNVTTTSVKVGDSTLEPADRDAIVLDDMVLSYTTSPKRSSLNGKEEHVKVGGSGVKKSAFGIINIIGPVGVAAMTDADFVQASSSTDPAADKVLVTVGVEIKGHLSGSGQTWSTGKYFMPLTVVRSTCTDFVPKPEFAICGNLAQSGRVCSQ